MSQQPARGAGGAHASGALEGPDCTAAIYHELRRIAAAMLRHERSDHTLSPTALIHEAWLRLRDSSARWQDRAHFARIAASTMRRVLVDHARARRARKRGAGAQRLMLSTSHLVDDDPPAIDVIALNEALDALARVSSERARVIELRYFAGLGAEEIARELGLSASTVRRYSLSARRWLQLWLAGNGG